VESQCLINTMAALRESVRRKGLIRQGSRYKIEITHGTLINIQHCILGLNIKAIAFSLSISILFPGI